ncbi:tumor necrosis factor ligand superfamily member 10-like isoform X2 [Ornithorhynchus anatinus]|uniref:tumor necrosis factor ligand superfamily member 10-like isoform X2 n=1 Tax=Ornithorhynchus anatinus TaxID=9258 RepID=UPI0010A942BC|nr:tumor necrosis factor ligand superfamily member 10-like isoform X2 [Ornithorhynchus anatinus]
MAGCPGVQPYFRSASSDSSARMMGSEEAGPRRRRRRRKEAPCGPAWVAMALMSVLALQIASTTGLFVYFTMAISKLKSQAQGSPEELKCLQLINSLQEVEDLEDLFSNQSCLKLVGNLKSYVTTVTEDILRRSIQKGARSGFANASEGQLMPGSLAPGAQPSAHLTLQPHGSPSDASAAFGELPQSCRHPIQNWEDLGLLSHLRNVTHRAGALRINQGGKYYVYSQIYFRYLAEGPGARPSARQLVQCVSRRTSYRQPILLLKGVGTKCWAPEAEYGLHAVYQGGLFELRAGDELLVSVSTPAIDYTDGAASYFGVFRLDV